MDVSYILVFLEKYLNQLIFYLPIGIIGIWRWGVWLIKKIIGFFYRAPSGNFSGTIGIITPVYNENPETFRRALESWQQNNPDEIIAVIDFSNDHLIAIFKDFQKKFPKAKLIITKKPGKRAALVDGINASNSEVVALVDSDTVWSPNIKNQLIAPFSDPKLGGLVPRQDVLGAKTWAQKIFKIHLANRYLSEFPFLATVSDALTCLSGRTAVYRKKAVEDKLDMLENEHFMGKQMISGDDKTLTNLVQAAGWKTTFLRDIKVYTTGVPKLTSLLKQELRWARNAIRSDVKIIFSDWLWKNHKMLLLHMFDKFIQPITTLLAPIYFVVSLIFGFWQGAMVIALWWLLSRTVKIYPYLKENPKDITILPLYIFITFITATIRIYALLTLDEQGWITRWDKKRLFHVGIFKKALSYMATLSIVFALSFLVFNYKNVALSNSANLRSQIMENLVANSGQDEQLFLTPELQRLSDDEIAKQKNLLLQINRSDMYGYYVVKNGDTARILQRKFNLSGIDKILNPTTKNPLSNPVLLPGQKIAISTLEMRSPIQRSILIPNPLVKPPRVTYEAANNTIFVREGGSVATLTKISEALRLSNPKVLEQTSPGEWILRANIYVGKNVTLVVDGAETRQLKLQSEPGKFIWVRSESGNILFSNTKVTSWNEATGGPDMNHDDGRSYITAKNSGRMDIINSDLGYLGYVGFPKRGGEFGGSYGVSWKIKNGGFRDSLLTGVVTNSKFHNNYFGIYTYGATGMRINGNEFFNNIEYGLDPHDDSNNMLIEDNQAYNNGNHGIIISRRCFNNVIQNNISHNNRLHGIMLDRSSNNNLVQGNILYENVDGIAIYESNQNVLVNNEIRNNVRGIRMNAGSSENYAENNLISSNSRGVFLYDQANRNLLFKNKVTGSEIGITIRNASDNNLFENLTEGENQRAGRVTSDSLGNNIQ